MIPLAALKAAAESVVRLRGEPSAAWQDVNMRVDARHLLALVAATEALEATAQRKMPDGSLCWCVDWPEEDAIEEHFEECEQARTAYQALDFTTPPGTRS